MGWTVPVASIIKVSLERRCIPAFRSPVFDTTSPGAGRQTETAQKARHGNLTPPRISPSCPQAGVSLCTDEVMAKQLVRCFWTDGYRSPPYIGRLLCGKPAQVGLGASSRVALRLSGASSGNVFQSPDVQFSRCKILTGIRQKGKTARGYCSSRSNRCPPGAFSIAGAVLPAWVTAC